jgi:hypothetical protein
LQLAVCGKLHLFEYFSKAQYFKPYIDFSTYDIKKIANMLALSKDNLGVDWIC